MHVGYCSHAVSLGGFMFAPLGGSDEGAIFLQYSIQIYSFTYSL